MDNLPVIVIRFALYADLMVLAGMVAFSLYALSAGERVSGILPLRQLAVVLSLVGLILSGLGMFALAASMTGSSLVALDGEVLREIIGESAIGTGWIVRMAAMGIAVFSAFALDRRPSAARLALLASTALAIATLVWTGHAGATEGWTGTGHRLSDIIHMLAASVWLGGIAAFAWILFRHIEPQTNKQLSVAHRALEQFARVGTVTVGLIVSTGLINGLILIGLPGPSRLLASLYGQLLLAKLALFGAMLALASANRWRLTPALGSAIDAADPASAIRDLRRSLFLECAAALAILTLVAWLGTLEPPGVAGLRNDFAQASVDERQ